MRDAKAEAALALHRFGFGPRGGDAHAGSIAAIAGDPRGALLAEIDRPQAGQIVDANLPSAAASSRAVFEDNAARRAQQIAAQRARQASGDPTPMNASMTMDAGPPAPPLAQQILAREAKLRFAAAANAEIGFAERLVWFWSNHFCISAAEVPAMAGGYEREAIRPHVLGRFADMLLASEGHPAMLAYLDNASSLGPNSVAGLNRNRGLNENLAREIMELHTLGVRSGYTQGDVTRFAKVLTGWTILPTVDNPDHGAEFVFNKRLHEPGPQVILGKTYDDTGVSQGRTVLNDLARHPATARHVATKLARHFVADQAPPKLVERLAGTFQKTDGDLKQVTTALVTSDEAWTAPRTKLKRPDEWLAGLVRALGITQPDMQRILPALALLGQPLWRPPAPNGFQEDEAIWINGLPQRLDMARITSERFADKVDPAALVDTTLGPLASDDTRQTVARAASRGQAVALLLMSPEFLRR